MREEQDFLNRPVLSLQTMLRTISQQDDRVLPVIPNGVYGRSTYGSVSSFQEAGGLPVTGLADRATWEQIRLSHDAALEQQRPPRTEPIWAVGQQLCPGESNLHLYLVQALLTALSQFDSRLTPPPLSQTLDPVTAEGLKWVQTLAELPPTGCLDTLTWHALNDLYRVSIGDGIISG